VITPPFGERYFATRERLADVMRGIADLAQETAIDLSDRLPLGELQTGLGSPLVFVVCGEVNAGKSTLLNGLLGHELCPVGPMPETNCVIHYCHGEVPRDVRATSLLEMRERPIGFLSNFNLIDTPGTDSSIEGHSETAAQYLPTAELILIVFAISNPWSPATWNWVSDFSNEELERAVLIVQQADQREADDVRVILGHMTDLSMKRLGRTLPIFAVSGKLACEAKRMTPPARDLFRASGFPELESFISKQISESTPRKDQLEIWRSQAASALYAVEDHIEGHTHRLDTYDRFLDTILREIDDIRERFLVRLPRHLAGVAEVFETEAIWVSKRLRRRLGVIPSFFRIFIGDRTGPAIEAVFISRLQSAVEAVADQDGIEVVEFCRKHWSELGERVKSTIALDLGSADSLEENLSAAKNHFVQSLGSAARHGIGNLKVRNRLDKDVRRRNRAIKSFIFTTLVLINIGAICGALGVSWLPNVFCGLAGFFLIGGILTSVVTRKSIITDFQHHLLDTCSSFASTLRTDYEDALRIVFKDYASSLSVVRTHLAHERLAADPRLRRWQELFLTLKAIEQEL
jgi:GTPase Era involved in 16S rRNA processing